MLSFWQSIIIFINVIEAIMRYEAFRESKLLWKQNFQNFQKALDFPCWVNLQVKAYPPDSLFRIWKQTEFITDSGDLKQTDEEAERRRSPSNLHWIESEWCQEPSKFTWPWVFLNGDLLVDRCLSAAVSVCLRSLVWSCRKIKGSQNV